MKGIRPHLWFDKEAVEAAELYTATFPDSKVTSVDQIHGTPSGDVDVVSFQVLGQPFQAISAGPLFRFTPATSFLVRCDTPGEVDELWAELSKGGNALMPLDSYPFSDRYGWTEDRFGLSWQLMHDSAGAGKQRVTPALMFAGDVCGKAGEAVDFYTSVFPGSSAAEAVRYAEGEEPDRPGTIKHAGFELDGHEFAAMDSARVQGVGFNEAISFMVACESQDEIDYYWDRLSAVPESEQCGWLKDRFGVSWQVVPTEMDEMMSSGTEEQLARVTEAFLGMKKFDVAELRRAYEGAEARAGGR